MGSSIYSTHRLDARVLLPLGVAVLAIGSLISLMVGIARGGASTEIAKTWTEFWQPSPEHR